MKAILRHTLWSGRTMIIAYAANDAKDFFKKNGI
jgi:hypothetical protein